MVGPYEHSPLSPATHYAIEVVRGEVKGVIGEVNGMGERVDKLEESQGRHRTMFEQVKLEFAAFKEVVARESGSTKTILKVIAWAAGVMATGVVSIVGMMIFEMVKAHIR
jgi:hypothetical protein